MGRSERISPHKIAMVRAAINQGLMEREDVVSLIDEAAVRASVADLIESFPVHFAHCFAVKANCYGRVLSLLAESGIGAEVASAGELELALRAGFGPKQIVFDGPVKTKAEIECALRLGIALNVDNFQELERVANAREETSSDAIVGIRINPQIGPGRVALSSTATQTSKFGIGLTDGGARARLIDAYKERRWLTAIHVHVGSVGCPLLLMCEGIARTVDLADEINGHVRRNQVQTINIGGGLPVDFDDDTSGPGFSDYAETLQKQVPRLFTTDYRVVTEFGRSIIAKTSATLARVEYTKTMGKRHIALTHAGAHNHMRMVFQPSAWQRRVTAFSGNGALKEGPLVAQDIAGPCCFAGDIIAHRRPLPLLEPGDLILVHDTGAYCFSNHFAYNTLPAGSVYGVGQDHQEGRVHFDLYKAGQTIANLMETYF